MRLKIKKEKLKNKYINDMYKNRRSLDDFWKFIFTGKINETNENVNNEYAEQGGIL